MNLIEAIKSGKRFRRGDESAWTFQMEDYHLSHEDILADDWEIEEPTISVTRSQVTAAWKNQNGKMAPTPSEEP